MSLGDNLKMIRQRALLTQEEFAFQLNVALSTVNRWEKNKARPSLSTMKALREFCKKNDFSFSEIENSWLNFKPEDK